MKEIPLLFKPQLHELVRSGSKVMTSRLNFKGSVGDLIWVKEAFFDAYFPCDGETDDLPIPMMKSNTLTGESVDLFYKLGYAECVGGSEPSWKSPLFMPKWAARTWCEITAAKLYHIGDITDEECMKEGILGYRDSEFGCMCHYHTFPNKDGTETDYFDTPREAFKTLWNAINGKPRLDKANGCYVSHPFDGPKETIFTKHRGRRHLIQCNPSVVGIEFRLTDRPSEI